MTTDSPSITEQIQAQIVTIQALLSGLPTMLQRQMQEIIATDQRALFMRFEEAAVRIQTRMEHFEQRLQAIEAKLMPELDADDGRLLIAELHYVVQEVEQLKTTVLGDSNAP